MDGRWNTIRKEMAQAVMQKNKYDHQEGVDFFLPLFFSFVRENKI